MNQEAVEMNELLDLLRADLTSMAVPGTIVAVSEAEDGWTDAKWERRDGEHMSASFLLGGALDFSDVRVRSGEDPIREESYRAFLSGPQMANLRSVARSLLGVVPEREDFVAPMASDDEDHFDSALSLLGATDDLPSDKTNLIFVTGAAGDGKTVLLQHMVRQRANAYRSGQTESLWMYVSAQGRRLAKLDDAVGRDLGALQATFSFEAVPTLVRCGVLVLVIDGFDELLGVAGSYDESFSSLASFLDQLRSFGAVVAAARSVYYEQEFVVRIDRAIGFRSEGWEVRRIALEEWGPEQRREYAATAMSESAEELYSTVEAVFAANANLQQLGGKPFFVTRVLDLVAQDQTFSATDSSGLLGQLVQGYLSREVNEKLLERAGRPYLNVEQLSQLMSEFAEEMWLQDTTELTRNSVREIVEVISDDFKWDNETQQALLDRAPNSALLKSGSTPGSVAFEHDVYLAFFLSAPIVAALRVSTGLALRQALRRSIPDEAAEMVASSFAEDLEGLLRRLSAASEKRDVFSEQVSANAGKVAGAAIKYAGGSSGLLLGYMTLADRDLRNTNCDDVRIVNCRFIGCDFTDSEWAGSASNTFLERCQVSMGSTRLALEGLAPEDVQILAVWDGGASRTLYAPSDIRVALDRCSVPLAASPAELWKVAEEGIECLEALARLFSRTNMFTEDDDDGDVRRVVSNRSWMRVRDVLLEKGVLAWEFRSASGRKVFLRAKTSFIELLAGLDKATMVSEQLRAVWSTLELELPAPIA